MKQNNRTKKLKLYYFFNSEKKLSLLDSKDSFKINLSSKSLDVFSIFFLTFFQSKNLIQIFHLKLKNLLNRIEIIIKVAKNIKIIIKSMKIIFKFTFKLIFKKLLIKFIEYNFCVLLKIINNKKEIPTYFQSRNFL